MDENEKLLRFQTKLKYMFNDPKLLKMALTHNHMHMNNLILLMICIMKELNF